MAWLQAGYWAVAAVAIGLAVLLSIQAREHRRYARGRGRRVSSKAPTGRVALLVPCKGADADFEANLRRFFQQDHPNYELVLIVESVVDEAYEPIRRLIAECPGCQARLVIAGMATTSGQKVHNLLVATEKLPSDVSILAFAVADVRPPADWLRLLTQRLYFHAAATGYRWFVPKRLALANLLVASIDSAVVPIMFPGIHHKVWGGSWAIRRDVFESLCMREAWQGTLSDDLVASHVLARIKQPLALETACILPSPIDLDLRSMLSWVRRQFIIGRFYSPVLWSVVFVGHSFGQLVFWASAACALVGYSMAAEWAWQPATVVGLLYALHVHRAWLRQSASRFYLPDQQRALTAARRFDILCGPLGGLTLLLALVGSAIGRRIAWKNNVYEMRYGGQIRKIPTEPEPMTSEAASGGAARRAA